MYVNGLMATPFTEDSAVKLFTHFWNIELSEYIAMKPKFIVDEVPPKIEFS
jgi:hypothetical protein